jgi:hypothetical protein
MRIVHSRDGGHTWSESRPLFDRGVLPRLLQLANGVMVLTYGRPGVWMSFSTDGGHAWSRPREIVPAPTKGIDSDTCGYTSLLALGDDSFLMAYSEQRRPNARGEPCKSILVRRVTVS